MRKPDTNNLIQKGADSGWERLRQNIKDTASNGSGDSPEEYGGDKIDGAGEYIGHKTRQTVNDTGGKIKDKVVQKVRDTFQKERPKEKTEQTHDSANAKYTEPVRERNTTSLESRDYCIKEKAEHHKESVKTKDNYIRAQNEPHIAELKKELPKSKTEPVQKSLQRTGEVQHPTARNHGVKTVRSASRQTTNVAKTVGNSGKGAIKTANKGTVKTVGRNTVKTAQAGVKTTKTGVKTAQQTAKVAVETAKRSAQVAQKAAQAAAKAAQAAAKAAAAAAKAAVKAVVAAAKAIAAAVKGIIAAIAAGGWVAVVIILAIAIVALIICACCGVFASNETEDGLRPMTEAIQTIDTDFRAGIDAKIAELSTGYDEVVVRYSGDMDGDSNFAVNWNDVIAVYSVAVTMDAEAPNDVVEVTPQKTERLKTIFHDMNTVEYSAEVMESESNTENDDGEEETSRHKKLIITVNVQSLDCYDAADLYGFTEDQREALDAMMEPQMLPLYAELIGVDVYGGADLTGIVSGLPSGKMGTDVLHVALTKVGNTYVLGAKGPNRFDCSGLVYWSINEIDPALGKKLYTSAGYQYKYCKENGYLVGESEIQPGDLIFWYKPNCSCGAKYAEVHHVGFYLGDGMILDASSSNGRVVIRKLWSGSSYKILAYARPYSY